MMGTYGVPAHITQRPTDGLLTALGQLATVGEEEKHPYPKPEGNPEPVAASDRIQQGESEKQEEDREVGAHLGAFHQAEGETVRSRA